MKTYFVSFIIQGKDLSKKIHGNMYRKSKKVKYDTIKKWEQEIEENTGESGAIVLNFIKIKLN